jgi:hypothetical protein
VGKVRGTPTRNAAIGTPTQTQGGGSGALLAASATPDASSSRTPQQQQQQQLQQQQQPLNRDGLWTDVTAIHARLACRLSARAWRRRGQLRRVLAHFARQVRLLARD